MKLFTNLKPYLPEGTEFNWSVEDQLVREGLSVNIDFSNELTTGFNEGQSSLLLNLKEIIIPPLWVLAHCYINNEKIRNILDKKIITTSSIREIKGNKIDIYHQITSDDGNINTNCSHYKNKGYGIKVPLELKDYPEEDLPLETLVNDYPKIAKAIFLMNDEQLNELLLKMPKIKYDSEKPAVQGISFIDSRKLEGIRPYLFGFHRSGFAGKANEFFGVTIIEYVPVVSYPIKYGKKNEIEITYSPGQFYELTKTFEKLKKSLSKKNIKNQIRKKIEPKVKSLEEALFKPLNSV